MRTVYACAACGEDVDRIGMTCPVCGGTCEKVPSLMVSMVDLANELLAVPKSPTVYVLVHDCGLNGAAVGPIAYRDKAEAERAAKNAHLELVPGAKYLWRQVTGYGGCEVQAVEVQ